jgi:DNA-binding XRE family transcriptional regulator
MPYSDFAIAVGLRFKEARKKKNLTQTEVGELVGHTKSWYVDIERGKNNIYFNDAKSICELLDIDIDDLATFASNYKKST